MTEDELKDVHFYIREELEDCLTILAMALGAKYPDAPPMLLMRVFVITLINQVRATAKEEDMWFSLLHSALQFEFEKGEIP